MEAFLKGFSRKPEGWEPLDGRDVIERWKQHFDENLNGAENVGAGGQGRGENDCVSTAEEKT